MKSLKLLALESLITKGVIIVMSKTRTIEQIYYVYHVPQLLQLHLLRVAAVARLIADNWDGPALDRQKLDRVLLLHDIGNIVKIDLNAPGSLSVHEDLQQYLADQQQYQQRFGQDDHLASREIAREIGLTSDELDFMDAKIFVKNEVVLHR